MRRCAYPNDFGGADMVMGHANALKMRQARARVRVKEGGGEREGGKVWMEGGNREQEGGRD